MPQVHAPRISLMMRVDKMLEPREPGRKRKPCAAVPERRVLRQPRRLLGAVARRPDVARAPRLLNVAAMEIGLAL